MPASNVNQDRFSFPPIATLRSIGAIHQELLDFIKINDATVVEFSADGQIDISVLQLLEAARLYAGTAGKTIELAEPAAGPLLDTLRRSGFLEGMSAEDAHFWLHQGNIQ
jgi:hypothetical protein